jgi:nucleoside-diphosphate-sugar epimerase
MRAFVTGGTGFLGRRNVRRLLDRGDEVVMLARDAAKAEEFSARGARVVVGDLSDIDAFAGELRGCDVVYHAGARVVSHGDWDEFLKSTVTATEKLIDVSLAAGVKRFVHVSSLGIFEIERDGITVTEQTPYDQNPRLRGHYTRSKIDADRIACAAARAGKPVVVVRPGRIYGPDHPQQPLFFGRVKKWFGSSLVVVSKPSYLTPIAYVENAADAVIAAGTTPGVEGEIFNVIDDPDLTQGEYFRALKGLRRCPSRFVSRPVGVFVPGLVIVDLIHRLLKRRQWPIAYQLLRSERNARYTTDNARTKLSWTPRVGLRQAVEETVAGAK